MFLKTWESLFVRLSIGLEAGEDLLEDIKKSLTIQ